MFSDKKTDKTDMIILYDEINNREIQETDKNIEANIHVLVLRRPQKAEPIEITYVPKLTGENTQGQLVRYAALKEVD